MPFTIVHPLAVLPLRKKKYFDFTALVMGTMAPDFEYFINFTPNGLYGHTLIGQLIYNLPLVIIVSFLFHYLIKESLILHLPKKMCKKYYYLIESKWRLNNIEAVIIFFYSALIGMFTHLFWDSFTHKGAFFVSKITYLSMSIKVNGFDIPMFKVLQHGSTLIGGVLLFVWFIHLKGPKIKTHYIEVSSSVKFIFWNSFIVSTILIGCSVLFITGDYSIGRIVVSFMSSSIISITVVSILSKIRRRKLGFHWER